VSCKGGAKKLKFKELVLQQHAQVTIDMATSTSRKTTIMKDQNIMALFTILNSKLVLDEANKYFMFQRKEELGKL
jgi:hypothetical protein